MGWWVVGWVVVPEGNGEEHIAGEQRGVQVTLVAGGKLLNTLTLRRHHHHNRYYPLNYLIPLSFSSWSIASVVAVMVMVWLYYCP